MDEQTMKDYIEDLLQERAALLERLHRAEAQAKHLATELERLEKELARHV